MKNLNNLPPFYVGQKVVYITGFKAPKDSIHTVKDVIKQPCGCYALSIETKAPREGIIYADGCEDCGKDYMAQKVYTAWNIKSFRPLQESVFPSLTMSKVLEKESQLISMN